MQSGSKCLADSCDAVMNTKSSKTKCNPAAVARNHHLCEVASRLFSLWSYNRKCKCYQFVRQKETIWITKPNVGRTSFSLVLVY
ncbi:hypothetical protein ACFX2C_038857 [Malus domestica]